MVGDVEVGGIGRRGLEALEAVPGEVLDGEEGAFGEEEEIEVAMGDDGVVGPFDYRGEGAEGGGGRLIVFWEEVRSAAADEVVGWGGVDYFLDVWGKGMLILMGRLIRECLPVRLK